MVENEKLDITNLKLVRGINCDHLSTFDLKKFLLENMYTENRLFNGDYNLRSDKD